jgi:squalene monooxygenase
MHSLQQACFAYFRLGGRAVSGPVGLLSVLSPNPLVLIGHFFAVAFYTMYFAVKCEKWWSVHRSMFKGWSIFWKACCLLFPLLWSERFSVIATN